MKGNEPFDATIHQPDFLPWLGFFDKIFSANRCIVFDTVPISSGKSWSSRVKILVDGNEKWLTMPIQKKSKSGQSISEVQFVEGEINWKKNLKTIDLNYRKAPFHNEIMEFLIGEIRVRGNSLADFNFQFIEKTTRRLGNYNLEFSKCSNVERFRLSELKQTDLIVDVCDHFNVKEYLSGTGCLSFLEEKLFRDKGVNISFRDYVHPYYKQIKSDDFIPGLSILDALMNVGFIGVSELLPRKTGNVLKK